MSNTMQYYDMASLAEASYVLFDEFDYTSSEKVKENLQNPKREGHFSSTQAADFVQHWEVVSHQPNTDNGFSATLFKNKDTGKFYYACRGTAGLQDLLITDGCDIVTDGLAINQIVDLYNDWQRIKAPLNQTYQAAKLVLQDQETFYLQTERLQYPPGISSPYELALRARNDVIIDMPSGRVYKIGFADSNTLFTDDRAFGAGIPITGDITAIGHSMGGHLADAFSRLFSSECSDVLTINGAGYMTGVLGGMSGNAPSNIRNLFALLGGADSFDESKVLNLNGDKWIEFKMMDFGF